MAIGTREQCANIRVTLLPPAWCSRRMYCFWHPSWMLLWFSHGTAARQSVCLSFRKNFVINSINLFLLSSHVMWITQQMLLLFLKNYKCACPLIECIWQSFTMVIDQINYMAYNCFNSILESYCFNPQRFDIWVKMA